MKYKGVVVPMVSPLSRSKEVDVAAAAKIMTLFARNNISPLVLGTTGESTSFDLEESATLVEAVVKAKSEQQLIYVGLAGNNVKQQIEFGNRFFALGADVAVATLPSYYILTPEQMLEYYITLADKLQGPLMMYNIKATTQMSIPLGVIEKLSHHPNILGLKDSERDQERMEICINKYKDREDFSFFCGWGAQSANSLKLGADGIVPSTGNIVPVLYNELYTAVQKGDFDKADLFQQRTDEVAKIYQTNRTLGQSLAALKVMMSHVDLCQPYMKPPLTELDEQDVQDIKSRMADCFIKA